MTDEYEDQGVVIMEVNSAMTTQAQLVAWVADYDYLGFRVVPADQILNDFESTQEMKDARVYVLIDLTTMEVINGNCGSTFEGGEACIDDNL